MDREKPYVQELILWGLAFVAIALLLKVAFWPHSVAAPEPTPQQEVAKSETTPQISPIRVEILNGGGESQVAARLRKKARVLGLDVIHEGNAPASITCTPSSSIWTVISSKPDKWRRSWEYLILFSSRRKTSSV